MKHSQTISKRTFVKRLSFVTGALFAIGFVVARIASRTVEDSEPLEDAGPVVVPFTMNEREYPPYRDKDLEGVQVEGEFDENGEKQLAVIGVPKKEIAGLSGTFAIARCDATSLWHPAVSASDYTYSDIIDSRGEMAAVALYVGACEQHLALGVVQQGQFTPCKQTHLLGLVNLDGLLYDYPNMPIIHIPG